MMREVIPIRVSEPPLAMVVVEVTTWCNLQCSGCTRTIGMKEGAWNSRHMPPETFEKVLANLSPARRIVLHGVGEPTLNPHYLDFIRQARATGKFEHIVCITNGLTRSLGYFDQMLAAGMDSFTVSVDSLTQAIADVTRTGTRVEKLRERLRAFLTRGFPFSVSLVASRLNLADVPVTLRALDDIGVHSVYIQPYIEFDGQPNGLSDAQISDLMSVVDGLQPNLRTTRVNYPMLRGVAQGAPAAICASPWREPAVNVDGFLTPCCVSMSPNTLQKLDITKETFGELQRKAAYTSFLSSYIDKPAEFCNGCFNERRPRQERPLVSVTMVTYNHARFVREAVESVLAQTYSPLEIIISDDASTDDTASIVDECLRRYEGPHLVRFLRQPKNLGAKGRNNFLAGYREAQGQFIVWFCGDDVMSTTQVERMVDTWQRDQVTLVTVNAEHIDEDSHLVGRLHRDSAAPPSTSLEVLARTGANDSCFGAGLGFAKEMLETFTFDEVNPPLDIPPDIIFPFYAGLLSGCAMITEPLLRYRLHGGQTSASLALESEQNAGERLRRERDIWLGHAQAAHFLTTMLDRKAQSDSERFGIAASRLKPLLAEQIQTMETRAAHAEVELQKHATTPAVIPAVTSEQMLMDEAMRHLRTNDLVGAARACRQALALYPRVGHFWFMLALIMRSTHDYAAAAQMLEYALHCDPENPEYLNELASLGAAVTPFAPPVESQKDLDALTIAPRVATYLIDVSDECNLRCVYCHQSQPGYEGRPMAPALLETLQNMVLAHPPTVQAFLSSGGETTTLKDWDAIVHRFTAMGVPCALISNFARPFSESEITALSALDEILISIDTVDAELTKRIRKRSDIRTIFFNMQRIRAHCVSRPQPPPRMVWNVVGHDIALYHAPSLAAAAAVYRPDQVTIAQMKAIPGVEMTEVRTVDNLDEQERQLCAQGLAEALRIFDQHRIPYSVNEQLRVQLGLCAGHADQMVPAGMTRDCLMPWELFLTHSDGRVKPCCNAEGVVIGKVMPGADPFSEVFNGGAMRAWRRGLLEGNLSEACRQCTSYPVTSPSALAEKLRKYIASMPRANESRAVNSSQDPLRV